MRERAWREINKGTGDGGSGPRDASTTLPSSASPCPPYLEEEALQGPGARHVPQARQGLLFDLSHPLARDAEQRPDLFQRHRLLSLEPEAEAQDLGLAVLE